MNTVPLASYLRFQRLKAGMSQRELAELVGIIAHHQVSVHERSVALPSLMIALSYQVVFNVPINELFLGLYEPIRMNIEERLSDMEKRLQGSDATGRTAEAVARKLEWLCVRRQPEIVDSLE